MLIRHTKYFKYDIIDKLKKSKIISAGRHVFISFFFPLLAKKNQKPLFYPYPYPYPSPSPIALSIFSGIRRWDLNLFTAHSAALPSKPLSYASMYLHDLRANLRIIVTGTLTRVSGTFLNKSA